ncbi:Nif3-like dinuclear metal center hexameric protein [Methanocaldococcus sp.]
MIAKEVIEIIENLAPKELAIEWDNVGLQIGDINKEVKKLGIALDPSLKVLERAVENGIDFLLTHHPLFFKPIKNIDGLMLKKLSLIVKNNIVVYSAHTNLDVAFLNDALANLYKLKDVDTFLDSGLGRIGIFEGTFEEFLKITKEKLTNNIVVVKNNNIEENFKVAVLSGKGLTEDLIKLAYDKEVDLYLSGDLTHHPKILAEELGITLIDATHYYTEVYGLKEFIKSISLDFIPLDF